MATHTQWPEQEQGPAPLDRTLPSEEYVPQALPFRLTTFDMTMTFILVLFFITNVPTAVAGGASAFTFWVIGAITFFVPCVLATAQLGVIFPRAGSLYNWTQKALGPNWAFFVAFISWLPCSLLLLATSDLLLAYILGLFPTWLTETWQQGVALIGIVVFTTIAASQRYATVQKIVNFAAGAIGLAVVLIGLSGVVWLLKGHSSATSFSLDNWGLNFNPQTGNISLFGLITLAYLGVQIPLNMGGEIGGDSGKVIPRHLLWGALVVIIGYFVTTWAVLVVQGQNAAFVLFSVVSVVDMALGKFFGGITVVCVMLTIIAATMVYNYANARLLLVAGIDQRIPSGAAKLSRNRVPVTAIRFQALVACLLVVLFFMVIPYTVHLGIKPSDLSFAIYNVGVASATLIWAFGTIFLFVNVLVFASRGGTAFRAHLIVPLPLLASACVLGLLSGLLAMVDTVLFSFDPQVIPNGTWWWIICVVAGVVLAGAAIASLVASSEASWQTANI